MLLCLDVGNSQIYGGVFEESDLLLAFRMTSRQEGTSDQFGVFFKAVLRENDLDPKKISAITFCSVVPKLDYSVRAACLKYFGIEPKVLSPCNQTCLTLAIAHPEELGADRLATAIAAAALYPNQNRIVVDFGTATTLCVIDTDQCYRGGAILAGMKLCMEALQQNAAKLSDVEIVNPGRSIGIDTIDNIQIGLYDGQFGAVKHIIENIIAEHFPHQRPILIGTGGFSHLFERENFFDAILPDLVLQGLRIFSEAR